MLVPGRSMLISRPRLTPDVTGDDATAFGTTFLRWQVLLAHENARHVARCAHCWAHSAGDALAIVWKSPPGRSKPASSSRLATPDTTLLLATAAGTPVLSQQRSGLPPTGRSN